MVQKRDSGEEKHQKVQLYRLNRKIPLSLLTQKVDEVWKELLSSESALIGPKLPKADAKILRRQSRAQALNISEIRKEAQTFPHEAEILVAVIPLAGRIASTVWGVFVEPLLYKHFGSSFKKDEQGTQKNVPTPRGSSKKSRSTKPSEQSAPPPKSNKKTRRSAQALKKDTLIALNPLPGTTKKKTPQHPPKTNASLTKKAHTEIPIKAPPHAQKRKKRVTKKSAN